MSKIIGLTGGIGSGKTTIAKHFESLGVPIYIADIEAKKITNKPEVLKKIKSLFGISIFDGEILNRKKLGTIVFNNPDKLKELNAVIHPEVKIHFDKWLKKHSNALFVIKESAILIETGDYKFCDFVITVISSLENRIQRIMVRDSLSEVEVMIRIKNQISDKERIEKSNFIINNDIKDISIEETNLIHKTLMNRFTY